MKYSQETYDQVKSKVLAEASQMRVLNKVIPVTGERIDLPVDGRTINIVLYRTKEPGRPLILGYHGGGFLFGGNAMNDAMWSTVRDRLNMNVASVEYRKSPDYHWREALQDAWESARYLLHHAPDFGFDANRVSVMGCSAGATLAASLCLYAKQKECTFLQNQILMYPMLDSATDPDSKGKGSLEGPIMYVFNELHCLPEEAKLPLVSPVFATTEELKGLPPTVFCLADQDNLKAEGRKYAAMLEKAGVSTAIQEFKDMPHGFFESGFGKISEQEMSFLGKDVQEKIKNGKIASASLEALNFVKAHIY